MKLESITVENYRQFEKAELTFDEGITILAGANNSGKTSLINLIKNIFVDDKLNYNMSDIPAKNMREWKIRNWQTFLIGSLKLAIRKLFLLIEQFSMKEIRKDCIFGKS